MTLFTRPLKPFSFYFVPALLAVLASGLLLGACDSAGPSTQDSGVEVGFKTSYSTSASKSAQASPAAKATHDSLVVSGSNGTLKVTDVRLVVSSAELEGDADSVDFEADPTFLDLPLDTTDVAPVASSQIPPASYNQFEFEVEDVEIEEEEDGDEADQFSALRDSIHKDFPNWPEAASMVVVGTFTPDGDTARAFTAFFEAEIEVEQTLDPPLEVTGDGLTHSLTVKLDPLQWFSKPDGTVLDLAKLDYGRTGTLIEFEAEFEDGVSEVESGEDDGDDSGDDDDDDSGDE